MSYLFLSPTLASHELTFQFCFHRMLPMFLGMLDAWLSACIPLACLSLHWLLWWCIHTIISVGISCFYCGFNLHFVTSSIMRVASWVMDWCDCLTGVLHAGSSEQSVLLFFSWVITLLIWFGYSMVNLKIKLCLAFCCLGGWLQPSTLGSVAASTNGVHVMAFSFCCFVAAKCLPIASVVALLCDLYFLLCRLVALLWGCLLHRLLHLLLWQSALLCTGAWRTLCLRLLCFCCFFCLFTCWNTSNHFLMCLNSNYQWSLGPMILWYWVCCALALHSQLVLVAFDYHHDVHTCMHMPIFVP